MILKIENLEYPITTFSSYQPNGFSEPLIANPRKIHYFAKQMSSNLNLDNINLALENQKIKNIFKNKIEIIRTDETIIYTELNFETIFIQIFENVCILNIVFSE